jgi:hypothetical protein
MKSATIHIAIAEATVPVLQLAIGTPGNEKNYTPQDIQDIIFNGQIFHTDDALQEDLRKIMDFDPITRMAFLGYATHLASQAW